MPPLAPQPLAFGPIIKRAIWGGQRLGTLMGKEIGSAQDAAESWEIADHGGDVSVVRNGDLAGTSLRDLVQNHPAELFGKGRSGQTQFPLLVKLIDARESLSVQVHPNDQLAKTLANDNGKTESWVVLDAEPDALIYAGLKPDVTRDMLERAIEHGTVEPLLHRFEPKPGDCLLIEAGTVHAIGAGVLVAEIQQMSDTTFRLFDWNRVGADGNPRELHVEKGLRSTDFARGPVDPIVPKPLVLENGDVREPLAVCPYFEIERWTIESPAEIGRDDRFTILLVAEGEIEIRGPGGDLPAKRGETILLPASLGPTMIHPMGRAVVLACQQP